MSNSNLWPPPFIKRIQSTSDLLTSAGRLRSWLQDHVRSDETSQAAEQARQAMLRSIGELTESYVKLTRADTRQTECGLCDYIFGEFWSDAHHPRGLPREVRSMLISGEFVWDQFQASTIEDWNKVAHTQHVDEQLASKIRRAVLGVPGQPGLLYRLCSQLEPPQVNAGH